MNPLLLKNGIVQIATPYSTGTGFLLESAQLIVTSEHIVRDNREVVVYGAGFRQQVVEVLYLDEKYDLAFLAVPIGFEGTALELQAGNQLEPDQTVYAAGHPYGANFTVKEGKLTNLSEISHGISFFKHTALLATGYSGGPLINEAGHVIGINTFLSQRNEYTGFTLPASRIKKQLRQYRDSQLRIAALCGNCELLISEKSIEVHRCPGCNYPVQIASRIARYEPYGMALTVEQLLNQSGYDAVLARRGPNNWDIIKGSAHINISYYEKSGLIIGDSYLCNLPAEHPAPIYQYLLRQNYNLEGLTLSIKGQAVVLSLLIYDRYLNLESGLILFEHLFKKADDLDNELIEQYGATWIKEPPTIEKNTTL